MWPQGEWPDGLFVNGILGSAVHFLHCANFALGATDAKRVDEEQPPISAVISNKSYLFLTF